jgi:hypothetical protein
MKLVSYMFKVGPAECRRASVAKSSLAHQKLAKRRCLCYYILMSLLERDLEYAPSEPDTNPQSTVGISWGNSAVNIEPPTAFGIVWGEQSNGSAVARVNISPIVVFPEDETGVEDMVSSQTIEWPELTIEEAWARESVVIDFEELTEHQVAELVDHNNQAPFNLFVKPMPPTEAAIKASTRNRRLGWGAKLLIGLNVLTGVSIVAQHHENSATPKTKADVASTPKAATNLVKIASAIPKTIFHDTSAQVADMKHAIEDVSYKLTPEANATIVPTIMHATGLSKEKVEERYWKAVDDGSIGAIKGFKVYTNLDGSARVVMQRIEINFGAFMQPEDFAAPKAVAPHVEIKAPVSLIAKKLAGPAISKVAPAIKAGPAIPKTSIVANTTSAIAPAKAPKLVVETPKPQPVVNNDNVNKAGITQAREAKPLHLQQDIIYNVKRGDQFIPAMIAAYHNKINRQQAYAALSALKKSGKLKHKKGFYQIPGSDDYGLYEGDIDFTELFGNLDLNFDINL